MKLKKRFLQLGILIVFFVFTACAGGNKEKTQKEVSHSEMEEQHQQEITPGGMHKQHSSLVENFAHKDIVILEEKYPVGEETKKELEQVIDAYLQVKDALVKDDEKAVNKAVGVMAEKVSEVVPVQLEGKGLEAWQNHKALYGEKLKEMQHITGLENKRSYFSHISEIMYCTIKSFGLKQGNLFAAFCPMAFDNKGAYWITDNKKIQNPFFGSKMPKCGEIKEEL